MNLTTILFLLFCYLAAYAETSPKENKSPPQFLPHMIDHPNIGCPENSTCSPETGRLRQKWLEALKARQKSGINKLDSHRKNFGIPINIWTLQDEVPKGKFIHWDSHCKNHRRKVNPILLSQVIAKSFKNLTKNYSKEKGLIVAQTYLQTSKGISVYHIPRGERPLYIKREALGFTLEEEGHYYGLEVRKNGDIKITNTLRPKNFPQEVACPKELSEFAKKKDIPKDLYQEMYCLAVWNIAKKKFQTLMVGWSCS